MAGDTDWVERAAHLRTWSRDGVRAPHKPLLLLYILGRFQQFGSSLPVSYVEAEEPLKALLSEFGPPNLTSPAYPFHHLVNDGLWVVRTREGGGSPGSNVGALRSSGALGELDPIFAEDLHKDPSLLIRVGRALLETSFPETLHDDIAAQVGLNLAEPEAAVTMVKVGKSIRQRDPVFRDMVLMAYEYRCAICGWDGQIGTESVGLEAAHVRWFAIGGPDSRDNGVCLCSLHHKLLDKGVIGITREHTVAVSARFVGRSVVARQLVVGLLGKDMTEPQPGLPVVAEAHIDWHLSQVFRTPHRQAAT